MYEFRATTLQKRWDREERQRKWFPKKRIKKFHKETICIQNDNLNIIFVDPIKPIDIDGYSFIMNGLDFYDFLGIEKNVPREIFLKECIAAMDACVKNHEDNKDARDIFYILTFIKYMILDNNKYTKYRILMQLGDYPSHGGLNCNFRKMTDYLSGNSQKYI